MTIWRSGPVLPGFKSLCTTLLQSERYGTPLSVALRVLSQENREMRMAGRRAEGGDAAGQADRADDRLFPAGAVHGHHRPAIIQVSRLMNHG